MRAEGSRLSALRPAPLRRAGSRGACFPRLQTIPSCPGGDFAPLAAGRDAK